MHTNGIRKLEHNMYEYSFICHVLGFLQIEKSRAWDRRSFRANGVGLVRGGLFIRRFNDDGRAEDYSGGREWNLSMESTHSNYGNTNQQFPNSMKETSDEYTLALFMMM